MRVQLFALLAVCAMGCAVESPPASTDSPDVAELESDATVSIGDANTYTITQPAKGGVIPTAVGESIEIDTWIGTPTNLMGWVRLDTTSSSTWRLQVCGIRAGMVAEIDPGSGVLQQYTNLPDDPGCKYVNDLRSIRKFRGWFWSSAPGPGGNVAIGLGLSPNLPPNTGGLIVGSATIGYPNGVPDIHVCANPTLGTANAEIDPGSGRLALYQATNGCTDTNPGNSLRKFRAWFWALPPPL
jgi:hypothetical protein